MRRASAFRSLRSIAFGGFGFVGSAAIAALGATASEGRPFPLSSIDGLRLHNVVAQAAVLEGKKGVRITAAAPGDPAQDEQLAVIDGLEFGDGIVEAEIAGTPAPGATGGARGFVGIAFRVQSDLRTYDAFYLRPTNGRAEEQERRNHAAQYIAHPDWTWARLRKETPSKYESYVDLVPGGWTRIRIEVEGERARLYVHGQEQPTLIVGDLKSGPQGRGGIALWIDRSTVAHFRNLRVAPGPATAKPGATALRPGPG
jgi:hypothetical protein